MNCYLYKMNITTIFDFRLGFILHYSKLIGGLLDTFNPRVEGLIGYRSQTHLKLWGNGRLRLKMRPSVPKETVAFHFKCPQCSFSHLYAIKCTKGVLDKGNQKYNLINQDPSIPFEYKRLEDVWYVYEQR